jgi:hypothetical protein
MSTDLLLRSMFEGSARNDIDSVLSAFGELKRTCTASDLPALVDAMQSDHSDFWLRELLSEPISQIGGCAYLSVLFDALERGEREGHDNDGFCFHLTEMAASDPIACRAALDAIIATPRHKHKEVAEWLLEFCTSY